MKKITFLFIVLLTTLVFSCKEESLIKPSTTDNFVGNFELQKIELVIDGNVLVLPYKYSSTKFVFKEDGTFDYPEEVIFYDGKYKYSATDKTITFSDDDPEFPYKSVLNVEKSSDIYTLKSKTEAIPLDLNDDMTYDQEIGLFTLFSLIEFEDEPSVVAFGKKIGDDPKKFSMNYYLKKK